MPFDPTTQTNIDTWLKGAYDDDTKAEIQRLLDAGDQIALTNAFYQDLEFGTGGLRGIMGVGSNRVNRYTLGRATQGFANYLNEHYGGGATEVSVVVAHDNRNNSSRFAKLVADVFSANGIKVHFFAGMRPTPELSFAVRRLDAQGGVMLTASHNPKEYNGYKAYGPDGAQLVSPDDAAVMKHVARVTDVSKIKFERRPELVETIGRGIDDAYLDAVADQSLGHRAIAQCAGMPIVFSPIHGTGSVSVPPALARFGFTNVHVVEEQMEPDGDFPTVVYPNPEEREALTLALAKAREVDADLVLATDPDADRVGMAVKGPDGKLMLLNGNQAASLLVHYVLTARKNADDLKRKADYVVRTIVTTRLISAVAKSFGIECYETLTGFKYIGQLMTKLEDERRFLVGGEESYGYLVGEHARDKDAVVACAMLAEMAAYHKSEGRTVFEALVDLYDDYGFYKERLVSLKREGKSGAEEIKAMMQGFRKNPPQRLGGSRVIEVRDYLTSKSRNMNTDKTSPIDLPHSNVLQFLTEDGTLVSARPSGTEPKIKFYCSVCAGLDGRANYAMTDRKLDERIDAVMRDLGA